MRERALSQHVVMFCSGMPTSTDAMQCWISVAINIAVLLYLYCCCCQTAVHVYAD
jgi:hypothetical protein